MMPVPAPASISRMGDIVPRAQEMLQRTRVLTGCAREKLLLSPRHPRYGANSALDATMGYTTKATRSSGMPAQLPAISLA
jgi:hypothetical protein